MSTTKTVRDIPGEISAEVADVGPSRVDGRVVARLADLQDRVRAASVRVLESMPTVELPWPSGFALEAFAWPTSLRKIDGQKFDRRRLVQLV